MSVKTNINADDTSIKNNRISLYTPHASSETKLGGVYKQNTFTKFIRYKFQRV